MAEATGGGRVSRQSRPSRLSPQWVARIDAVLPFLAQIEVPGFAAMVPVTYADAEPGVIVLPAYEWSPVTSAFVQALYDADWIATDFDWTTWEEEAQTYLDPARVGTTDPQTIRQLFTTHVRKDRFCEGHLWQMVTCGHIAGLLRRLSEIRKGTPRT